MSAGLCERRGVLEMVLGGSSSRGTGWLELRSECVGRM